MGFMVSKSRDVEEKTKYCKSTHNTQESFNTKTRNVKVLKIQQII
jgi:hypothetical protein